MDPRLDNSSLPYLDSVVDKLALTYPNEIFAISPVENEIDQWQKVTWRQLSQAAHLMAWWIEENLGVGASEDHPKRSVLAYLGANNVICSIVMMAAIKTGYSLLFLSPGNSVDGQISLLRNTACTGVLHSDEYATQAEEIDEAHGNIQIFQVPGVDDLVDAKDNSSRYVGFGCLGTNESLFILHTSGSTGLPKPVHWSNNSLESQLLAWRHTHTEVRHHASELFCSTRRILLGFPVLHVIGCLLLFNTIHSAGSIVFLPSHRPLSAATVVAACATTNPQIALFPPIILEMMSEIEAGIDTLSKLEMVCYAGAPLPRKVGNVIKENVPVLFQAFGSTETGILHSLPSQSKEDWQYMEWAPSAGVDMQSMGDGVYEAVIQKTQGGSMQSVFYNFPSLLAWRTKNLFKKHPTNPNLWKYDGRTEDVIVFSNGEKLNPGKFEKAVGQHHLVKGALMVGQGKYQSALLIEPADEFPVSPEDFDALIHELWPVVEAANREIPKHAQVLMSKIAITSPRKPFKRTPNGSILRRNTINIYLQEIDALYSNERTGKQLGMLPGSDLPNIKTFLRKALALIIPSFPSEAYEEEDFFSHGADSLQVLALATILAHAMPKLDGQSLEPISPRLIYDNPNIRTLAETFQKKLKRRERDSGIRLVTRENQMADLIAKYTSNLPLPKITMDRSPDRVVCLTGTTGVLGSYILEQLLSDFEVSKIYCLNRSADSEQRQRKLFSNRVTNVDLSYTEFLLADFREENFGLRPEKYRELQDTVTCFIHSAWLVDSNMTLQSFEHTHIAGVRRCVDFAASAHYTPQIVFISSIASVANWRDGKKTNQYGLIPETHFLDNSIPLPQGYGESKHVAELILLAASQRSGIPSTVIRCGQLAGPDAIKGLWNQQDWLPALIMTSAYMGKIPNALGAQSMVDWVPINHAAKAVCEISFRRNVASNHANPTADVFHITNPRVTSWVQLFPIIQEHYYEARRQRLVAVEFTVWLEELKAMPLTLSELDKKPALNLLAFYESLLQNSNNNQSQQEQTHGEVQARFSTDRAIAASKTLRDIGPIDRNVMRRWLKQWDAATSAAEAATKRAAAAAGHSSFAAKRGRTSSFNVGAGARTVVLSSRENPLSNKEALAEPRNRRSHVTRETESSGNDVVEEQSSSASEVGRGKERGKVRARARGKGKGRVKGSGG